MSLLVDFNFKLGEFEIFAKPFPPTKEIESFPPIKKGDKVITLGGIHAKVLETNDETLIVQAEGGTSKFKINKTSIAKV